MTEPARDHIHRHGFGTELEPAAAVVSGNGVRVRRGANGVQTFVIQA